MAYFLNKAGCLPLGFVLCVFAMAQNPFSTLCVSFFTSPCLMTGQSFTFKLDAAQQQRLSVELAKPMYEPFAPPYSVVGGKRPSCSIALYTSGKCLIQGKGAAEWVEFVMEPHILQQVAMGYDEVLKPEFREPHLGVDESGKGDYFGPLVVAAVYVDPGIADRFKSLGVRDSKTVSSDAQIRKLAEGIRAAVGGRYALITVGPEAYNRLYATMGNVNKLLAWGHARAIENALEKVPDCPRAVSDQFGPTHRIEQALLKKGKNIRLEQRPRAEDDPAVAAASILARAGFIDGLKALSQQYEMTVPKGASELVKQAARNLIERFGPPVLRKTCKLHFKTTDQLLESRGGRTALDS